jgi:SAM-dependent methyltransferase
MVSHASPLCPACGKASSGAPLLAWRDVPVHQNVLCATADAARAVGRGDFVLRACERCDMAWNAAFDPARMTYDAAYESDQSHSGIFLEHVDARVRALLDEGVRGLHVVEAGCGSGYFLRRLCQRGGNRGTGYDPGYRGSNASGDGTRFVRGPFESERDGADVDVVVARHVIEHVPSPVRFLRSLATGLRPGARVYLETPAFEWITERTAFWDLFYEHCNYFTAVALANSVRLSGLNPGTPERVFRGQYLWVSASVEPHVPLAPVATPGATGRLRAFAARCVQTLERLRARVGALAAHGTLAVWGAAAKGATFANLIDPQAKILRCMVDINPARQGSFVAGSGHVIVAPEAVVALGLSDVLVMNPNYADEVRARLAHLGVRVRMHVLLDGARLMEGA